MDTSYKCNCCCKDCKHEFGGRCFICGLQKRKPEDFCSYGGRKETE